MLVDQKCEAGAQITFAVNITGNPQPIVRWYREGAEIYSNADFLINEDGELNSLTITRTYGEDTGDFTVAAVNVAGRATSTCHLEVEGSEAAAQDNTSSRIQRGPAPSTLPKPEVRQEMLQTVQRRIVSRTSKKVESETVITNIIPSALNFVHSVKAPTTKRPPSVDLFEPQPIVPPWKIMKAAAEEVDPNPDVVRSETPEGDLLIEAGSNYSYSNTETAPGTMAPMFKKTLEAVTTVEGDSTLFECFCDCYPEPEVKWYREGAFIEHNNDFVQSFDKNTGCARLLIRETFIDDQGRFTVAIQNPAGAASCSATLTVRNSPTPMISQRIQGISGDEASITDQELSGFESQDVANENEYATGVSELETTDAEGDGKSDFGYAQTALSPVNEEGSNNQSPNASANQIVPEVQVKAPSPAKPPASPHLAPRVTVALPEFTKLVEGSSTVFQAVVQSDPAAHVYWVKDGKPLMPGYRVKVEEQQEIGVYKLMLTMTFPEDCGEYTLFARNSHGEVSSSTQFVPEDMIGKMRSPSRQDILESRGRGQSTRAQENYYNKNARSPAGRPGSSLRKESASPSPSRRLQDLDQNDIEKLYRPVFLKKPVDKECRETTTTRLDCKVTGRPLPNVSWFKDGNQVFDDNYHHIVVKEDGVRSLIIENAGPADTGEYTIIAKNKAGKSVCSVNLTVMAKEQQSKPKILEKPQSAKIQAGEGIKLEVFASGCPSPEIIWIKENAVIQPEKMPWFQIEGVDGHGLLTIVDAKPHLHDGWYTATAVNKAGRDVTRFRINVQEHEAPVVEEVHRIRISKSRSRSRDVGAEFERKQMMNRAHADAEQVEQTQQVKRMPADMFDDSDLYDKANPQKPRFKTTIEPVKTTTLGTAHFECYLVPIGDPTMRVSWLLDGKPVDMANRIQPMLEFGYCALDFTSCFPRDSGVLTCRAQNSVHFAECSTTMIVKETKENRFAKAPSAERSSVTPSRTESRLRAPNTGAGTATAPEISMAPESQSVDEGRRAKFAARIHGNPEPRVTWYINGKAIMKSKRFSVKADGMYKLEIRETKAYDAGEVKLIAENEAGKVEHICTLDVAGKVDFRSALKTSKTVSSKISIEKTALAEKAAFMQMTSQQAKRPGSAMSNRTVSSDNQVSNELASKFTHLQDESRVKNAAFGVKPKHASEVKDKTMNNLIAESKAGLRTPTPTRLDSPAQGNEFDNINLRKVESEIPENVSKPIDETSAAASIREKIYDCIVTESHAISFKVRFHGFPEPTVQWLRNGKVIESTEREYIHFPAHDICELVIREAQVEDAGMITVCVFNKHGGEQCDAVLQVRSTPHVPMIIDAPKSVDAAFTETAKFEVTISHVGEDGYWSKDGQPITIDGEKVSELKSGPKRSISIANLDNNDCGNYCYHYAGMASDAAVLTVASKEVQILESIQNMTVLSGEVATFQVILSQENCNVNWLHNGVYVDLNSSRFMSVSDKKKYLLIIEDISRNDQGEWSCQADDKVCSASLFVKTVAVKKEMKSQRISEGQEAVFEGAYENGREGEWFVNGIELKPNDRMSIKNERGVSKLSMPKRFIRSHLLRKIY